MSSFRCGCCEMKVVHVGDIDQLVCNHSPILQQHRKRSEHDDNSRSNTTHNKVWVAEEQTTAVCLFHCNAPRVYSSLCFPQRVSWIFGSWIYDALCFFPGKSHPTHVSTPRGVLVCLKSVPLWWRSFASVAAGCACVREMSHLTLAVTSRVPGSEVT